MIIYRFIKRLLSEQFSVDVKSFDNLLLISLIAQQKHTHTNKHKRENQFIAIFSSASNPVWQITCKGPSANIFSRLISN